MKCPVCSHLLHQRSDRRLSHISFHRLHLLGNHLGNLLGNLLSNPFNFHLFNLSKFPARNHPLILPYNPVVFLLGLLLTTPRSSRRCNQPSAPAEIRVFSLFEFPLRCQLISHFASPLKYLAGFRRIDRAHNRRSFHLSSLLDVPRNNRSQNLPRFLRCVLPTSLHLHLLLILQFNLVINLIHIHQYSPAVSRLSDRLEIRRVNQLLFLPINLRTTHFAILRDSQLSTQLYSHCTNLQLNLRSSHFCLLHFNPSMSPPISHLVCPQCCQAGDQPVSLRYFHRFCLQMVHRISQLLIRRFSHLYRRSAFLRVSLQQCHRSCHSAYPL